ncbi:MAG: tRNA pseudouridine(38-40) synthase TruA [Bacillota bacterium]
MKNYKITIAYDGTPYQGWQKQGNTKNTLQEKFETILQEISGQTVEIFGSGRTDAGTHATGQVANFHMDFSGTPEELREKINQKLPETVAVRAIELVDDRFHARFHAKKKCYIYTIWNSNEPPVFLRKYSFTVKEPLDKKRMEQAAHSFIGTHDFSSFSANGKSKKSSVRTVESIDFSYDGEKIEIAFTGNGFLYQTVRIMVGTLIEIGEGKREDDILHCIEQKKRSVSGFTAPSKGLVLQSVTY